MSMVCSCKIDYLDFILQNHIAQRQSVYHAIYIVQ